MEKNLKDIIEESFSASDLALKIFGYANAKSIEKSLLILKENGLDKSIFNGKNKNSKYEKITKICPVCSIEFETLKGNQKEKTVCSISCSNSYFKHGINNPTLDKSIPSTIYEKISITVKNKYKKDIINGNRKQLKNGNSVKLHNKVCLNCFLEYTTTKVNQKYCSRRCSMNSEEVKQKFREGIKLRIKNGTHKGWASRNIISYPEKFFREVLENNKIEFEVNKSVKKRDLGIDCDSNYFLDFFIKNGNIDLEVDGKQHSYRKEHDKLRDELLINSGYNVYRIKWKSINSKNGKDYIKEEISKFLEYYKKIIKKMNDKYLDELANIKTGKIQRVSELIGNFEKNKFNSIANNFGCSIFECDVVNNNPELKSNLVEINTCLISMSSGLKGKYNSNFLKSQIDEFDKIYHALWMKYLYN